MTIDETEQSNRFWNGLIDDVHIYSYAMTSEEIAAITQNANMLLFK